MSWLFSQALVEAYLGGNFSDGEPSVPLNGNPTQLVYLPQDKMTKFSRLSRFGMIFKPLTVDSGEALLMSFRVAFLVKISHQQEKEPELTESEAECGEKWQGSFAKWNQDSYSWKTHQCSLLGDSDEFSETWPRWGLMRDGECWEQQTLEQTIKGTESGLLLPTPTAHNAKEGNYPAEHTRKTPTLATHAGGKLNPTWVEWLMGWPLGWTDLKPLEMDKCLYVQQPHGGF
jgi:hypothetical protein